MIPEQIPPITRIETITAKLLTKATIILEIAKPAR
jgi:hypothetical protein